MTATAVSPDEFRQALRLFASGVSVVTTLDAQGDPRGITVSAFTSVSLSPPLILVCVNRQSSSTDAIATTQVFAVNILAEGQEEIAQRFAARTRDRFAGVRWRRGATGVPILDDVLAYLECYVTSIVPGGDHMIVVGVVQRAEIRRRRPLLYYDGTYATLPSAVAHVVTAIAEAPGRADGGADSVSRERSGG